jgi:hypothetical protein
MIRAEPKTLAKASDIEAEVSVAGWTTADIKYPLVGAAVGAAGGAAFVYGFAARSPSFHLVPSGPIWTIIGLGGAIGFLLGFAVDQFTSK